MIRKIAKNWRVKMAAQKAIGLLPAKVAFPLNERMIRLVSGGIEARIDTAERANRFLGNVRKLMDCGVYSPGLFRSVLEVGTGWHGIDLILFHLLGAERIVTVDHWPHLTQTALGTQIRSLKERFNELKFPEPVPVGEVRKRLEILSEKSDSAGNLSELLAAMNARYGIARSCRLRDLDLSPSSVTFFYAYSVLQRIPREELEDSVSLLGNRLMTEGAFFIRTDQKDIHSQRHVDRGLWPLHFLKYSDRFYTLVSSEKLNYQNRLRESDYLKMLESAGLKPVRVDSEVLEEDIARLRSFRVDRRFEGYDLRDLAVQTSEIMGTTDRKLR